VSEVPYPGVCHHNTLLIRSVDHFLITHRPTRLDNAIRARSNHHIQTIAEREEGIRRHHRTS
jgi:hypothetical protein